jgi:2',3'-cyclic-nucleotide 2'-phosphodiesterase (5'-nucleotidase family)
MIVGLDGDEHGQDSSSSSSSRVTMNKIPLILGGHEHTVFHEVISSGGDATDKTNACTIFKAGTDISYIGVIDITWPWTDATCSEVAAEPRVEVVVRNASEYEADPRMTAIVDQHKSLLNQLVSARVMIDSCQTQ